MNEISKLMLQNFSQAQNELIVDMTKNFGLGSQILGHITWGKNKLANAATEGLDEAGSKVRHAKNKLAYDVDLAKINADTSITGGIGEDLAQAGQKAVAGTKYLGREIADYGKDASNYIGNKANELATDVQGYWETSSPLGQLAMAVGVPLAVGGVTLGIVNLVKRLKAKGVSKNKIKKAMAEEGAEPSELAIVDNA